MTPICSKQAHLRTKRQTRTCKAAGVWSGRTELDKWCTTNCLSQRPYCPASHCKCESGEIFMSIYFTFLTPSMHLSETNFIMHIMNSHLRYYYCSNKLMVFMTSTDYLSSFFLFLFYINNVFAIFGECIFVSTVGIRIGTNCPPLLGDLFPCFLFFVCGSFPKKRKEKNPAGFFNFTSAIYMMSFH